MVIEPTARGLFVVLLRRKKTFIFSMLAVLLAGAGYLLLATPMYRSEASVVIRFDDKTVSETNMARDSSPQVTAQNDRRETVVANAEILSSPDLVRQVIQSFGMDTLYPDIVEDPPRRGTPLDEGVRVFQKNLEVEAGQQGIVIQLGFLHSDKALAQTALQRLIDGYMNREVEIFSGSDIAFKVQQLNMAQAELAKTQAALQTFKAAAGITSFDDQMASFIKQRGDLSASLQNAEVTLGQATQRRTELRTLLATVSPNVQNSASGEKYHAADEAETRLAELRVRERQMLATYSASSPMLDQLRASIATAQSEVQRSRGAVASRDSNAPNLVYQNIQTDLLRATAEEKAFTDSVSVLKTQLAAIDAKMKAIEDRRTELNDLTRAVQISDNAYRAMALHLEDARVVENRVRDRISHGTLIKQPSLPYKPSRPRYLITAIATALASVMVGVMLVIGLELCDDRFTEPRQVEKELGIPVLATFGERG